MGRNLIDIAGQRFGRLVALDRMPSIKKETGSVVPWRCRCDCGGECLLESSKLRSGARSDCGCVHRENLAKAQAERESVRVLRQTALGRRPTQDETGKRFGRLTAIEYVILQDGTGRWRCSCDCGGESLSMGTNLRKGSVTSCGCILREKTAARIEKESAPRKPFQPPPPIDEVGNRHGRLLVIEQAPSGRYGAAWRCICDCGTEHIAYGGQMRRGLIRSCGCLKRDLGATRSMDYWARLGLPRQSKSEIKKARRQTKGHKVRKARRRQRLVKNLHSSYISRLLADQSGCKKSSIPASVIEAKRLELSIRRYIKENGK